MLKKTIPLIALVGLLIVSPKIINWLLATNKYSLVISSTIKLPSNRLTEQVHKFDQISADGTIRFPKGEIVVHVPSANIAGTEVEFKELNVEFERDTDLRYLIDFTLNKIDPSESNDPDKKYEFVNAIIEHFDFKFSHEVKIKYGNIPIIAVSTLDAKTESNFATPAELKVSTEARMVVGYAILQMMLDVPFEVEAPLLADINNGLEIKVLPRILIDSLNLHLGEEFDLRYQNSDFKLAAGSSIKLSSVNVESDKRLRASGSADISVQLGSQSTFQFEPVTISKPTGISLRYVGSFNLSDNKLQIEAGKSGEVGLAFDECGINFKSDDSQIAIMSRNLLVKLVNHGAEYDFSSEGRPAFQASKSNEASVSVELYDGLITSAKVKTSVDKFDIKNASITYSATPDGERLAITLANPTPIEISQLYFKDSSVQFGVPGHAVLMLPTGDLLKSENLQVNLKDFCSVVDAFTFTVPGSGLVHAEGVKFDLSRVNGTVYLADGRRSFEGVGALTSNVKKACYFENKSGKPSHCATDLHSDIEMVGKNGGIEIKGALSGGVTSGVSGVSIAEGEVSVALGGVEYGAEKINYSDIVVRIKETFLNRLIAKEIDALNMKAEADSETTKSRVEVSKALLVLHPTTGTNFKFSGSARVKGKYQTKTLPRVRMVRRSETIAIKFLGKTIGSKELIWHELQPFWDWMTIAEATVDGSLQGKAAVTFETNTTLDKLRGTINVEVSTIHVDIKDFPGGVETIISDAWRTAGNANLAKKFELFSSLDEEKLKLLRMVEIERVNFQNEEGVIVLRLAGSMSRK